VKGIADTGFIVAFANRDDQYHRWAVELSHQLTEPLLTCEAVLAEAAFHLQSPEIVLALVREGLLRLAFDASDKLPQLEALAKRYADRHPDLADLCLILMSEMYPDHGVVTVDRKDFRVYRKNKREVIPILCPREA
jgi:predicted nucleic acid-binding protein